MDSLVTKTKAWEEEGGFPFVYDGVKCTSAYILIMEFWLFFSLLMMQLLDLTTPPETSSRHA